MDLGDVSGSGRLVPVKADPVIGLVREFLRAGNVVERDDREFPAALVLFRFPRMRQDRKPDLIGPREGKTLLEHLADVDGQVFSRRQCALDPVPRIDDHPGNLIPRDAHLERIEDFGQGHGAAAVRRDQIEDLVDRRDRPAHFLDRHPVLAEETPHRDFFGEVLDQRFGRHHLRGEDRPAPVEIFRRVHRQRVDEFGCPRTRQARDDVQRSFFQTENLVEHLPACGSAAHDPVPVKFLHRSGVFRKTVDPRHRIRFRVVDHTHHPFRSILHQHVVDVFAVARISRPLAFLRTEEREDFFFQSDPRFVLVRHEDDVFRCVEDLNTVGNAFQFFRRVRVLRVRRPFVHADRRGKAAFDQTERVDFALGDADRFRPGCSVDVPQTRLRVFLLRHVLPRIAVFHVQQFAVPVIRKRHAQGRLSGPRQIMHRRIDPRLDQRAQSDPAVREIRHDDIAQVVGDTFRRRPTIDFRLLPCREIASLVQRSGPAAVVTVPGPLVAVHAEARFVRFLPQVAALGTGHFPVTGKSRRQVDPEVAERFHRTLLRTFEPSGSVTYGSAVPGAVCPDWSSSSRQHSGSSA